MDGGKIGEQVPTRGPGTRLAGRRTLWTLGLSLGSGSRIKKLGDRESNTSPGLGGKFFRKPLRAPGTNSSAMLQFSQTF